MAQTKKSIISFVILLSIVGGLVFPQVASAGIGDWILRGFIKAMTLVPLGLSKLSSSITYVFLKWITSDDAIKVSYIPKPGKPNNNPVVEAGWRVTRDLANMMVVLGFVIVGIATILRLREYEAQKLLPRLIIVAILINFSPLLCGLVIDASNITMNFFLKGSPGDDMLGTFKQQWDGVWNTKTSEDALAMAVGYILGNIVACIVFGLLFFLFIARYIMLWMLVIASPIAFVCYVFGFTKKYFQQWWNEFLKWCIMGIPAAFTLYLASVAARITIGGTPSGQVGGVNASIIEKLVTFSLPAMIMLVGFFYTLKFSGAGAALAIGAAGAVGGLALGAVKGVGGAAAKKLGGAIKESGAGQAVGGAWGKTKEALHWEKKGTVAQQQAQKREESGKRLKNLSSEKLAKIAEGRTQSRREKAAATELLAERGDLDKISPARLESAAAHATAYGVPRKTLAKANPSLARGSKEQVQKEMGAEKARRIAAGSTPKAAEAYVKSAAFRGTAQKRADNTARVETIQRMGPQDLRKLSPSVLTADNVAAMDHRQIKSFQRGTPAQITQLQSHLPALKVQRDAATRQGDTKEAARLAKTRQQIKHL